MPRNRITRKDPKEELSGFLNHNVDYRQRKVSASLTSLQNERRRSLLKRLGLITAICLVSIICLGYYVSPLADVSTIEVSGAPDLSAKKIVHTAGIKASDKVIDFLHENNKLSKKLANNYPEIKSADISVKGINTLKLHVNEYKIIGYIKDNSKYRKILSSGDVGSKALAWTEIDHEKPLFIGYSRTVSLKTNLKLFNSFPEYFKKQVKMLSGNTRRKSQIILVMKDGNVIIGNTSTISSKVKYYNSIKQELSTKSLIDLEIGAYSRPLTNAEKRAYGIS